MARWVQRRVTKGECGALHAAIAKLHGPHKYGQWTEKEKEQPHRRAGRAVWLLWLSWYTSAHCFHEQATRRSKDTHQKWPGQTRELCVKFKWAASQLSVKFGSWLEGSGFRSDGFLKLLAGRQQFVGLSGFSITFLYAYQSTLGENCVT